MAALTTTSPATCLLMVTSCGTKRKLRFDEPNLRGVKTSARACSLLSTEIDFENDRFQVVACTSQPTTSKEMEAPDNSSVQNFSNVISSEDDDGRDFTLPDLGILHDAVTGNNPLGSYATTRIVDVLFQEMTRFTLYPSKQFYRKVGTALVQRHHELADTCGSGHDSWVMLIRQKFKNERRKLETDRVCANRLKFGSSGKQPRAAVDTASMELQRGKVGAALSQDLAPSGEDEYSLAQHEAWLVTEWTKPNPDRQQMCCRLELTHSARVKDLCKLSIAEAIDKYPYLRDIEWVSSFFCTQFLEGLYLHEPA
ncbi:uncharacterized protein ISCGN_006882 [Ixodes scapularis]